ncbi:MAG TPA: glycosyltransferase family 4 protein, partial [Thermoanaerobaculia bacterium]|nr:glycosyltransferase family 4 protein [Thermoanaerobaculia bacterium]
LQFIPLLAGLGIDVDVRPFLSDRIFAGLYDRRRALLTGGGIAAGIARRAADVFRLRSYDLLFVQREAALIGPALFERIAHRSLPMVLDLDDSTYIERRSEVFGLLARLLKFHGKTRSLIRWADHVVAGNPNIAAHVESMGTSASVLPTIVDTAVFVPSSERRTSGVPVVGWIGTHSTYSYLRSIFPLFRQLAKEHRFLLRIVGAGREEEVPGVDVEFLPWRLERELADLQSFDLALYPIIPDAWAEGKSGFKAIQYLSCGIPYVATPAGVVAQIGCEGQTHLVATSEVEWLDALRRLLSDPALRERMSREGRRYAVEHYSVRAHAQALAEIFGNVVKRKGRR